MPARLLPLILLLPLVAAADDGALDARYRGLKSAYERVRASNGWEEIKKRRTILEELGDLDHPGAADLLFRAFTEDPEPVCRIPALIGLGKRANFSGLKATVAAVIRDRNDVYRMLLPRALAHARDERIGPWLTKSVLPMKESRLLRAATIETLGLLRCAEADGPIAKILGITTDPRTAFEALIAIARIRGARAVKTLLPYLDHEEAVLRQGAAEALAESGHPGAIEILPKLVEDPAPRVREAAATVAEKLGSEAAVPALLPLIRSGRLRLMDSARRALEKITDQKLGLDAEAWERWYRLKSAGKLPKDGVRSSRLSVATYYGLSVFSDRLLFVVDVSQSMMANESGREGKDDPKRIDIAQRELAKTIDQLDRRTMFNLVAFSGAPMWWRDSLAKATPGNVAKAKGFVTRLSVGGGTNVYDTLEQALEKNRLVDTIYFLGDGSPSLGKVTEQEEILARLRWMNRIRRVRIHTIALLRGDVPQLGGRLRYYDEMEASRFLSRMAQEHGGNFVLVER